MERIPSDDPKAEVGSFDRKVTIEVRIEQNSKETMDGIASELASIAMARAERRADVGPLIAAAKEAWNERAAIREYDGGMPRWEAERVAVQDAGEVMGLRYLPEKDLPAHARKPRQRAKRSAP